MLKALQFSNGDEVEEADFKLSTEWRDASFWQQNCGSDLSWHLVGAW